MAKISVYVPDALLERWRRHCDDRPDLSTSAILQNGLRAELAQAQAQPQPQSDTTAA